MEEITIEDKIYISSKQAAKITGYAKDYVGQLCREGRVEARLVGRSWYVLEDSIKEHRFGPKEQEEEPVEVVQDQRNDVTQTWKKPEYASMEPVTVPEFAQKQPEKLEESKAVADMQNAWKEWFQEKKALPDGSDDFREEYLPVEVKEEVNTPSESSDEPVSISRIREEEPVMEANDENEEEVQLHKSYDSVRSGEVVPATNVPVVNLRAADTTLKEEKLAKSASSKGNLVVQSTIVAVTILVVLVSLIGTGSADALLSGTSLNAGPQKAVTDYLGGTRTLNK